MVVVASATYVQYVSKFSLLPLSKVYTDMFKKLDVGKQGAGGYSHKKKWGRWMAGFLLVEKGIEMGQRRETRIVALDESMCRCRMCGRLVWGVTQNNSQFCVLRCE